ncbi:MAG: hypothetical protein FWD16_04785 [Clostridia bacterium]|nr:hypothetical protein [Clostridia bacterium]
MAISRKRHIQRADKHALKLEGKTADGALIFGHATYYSLTDFSNNFCHWLEERGMHFDMLEDIPSVVGPTLSALDSRNAFQVSKQLLAVYVKDMW